MDLLPPEDGRAPFAQQARRGRDLRPIVGIVAALVLVVVAVAKPWGGQTRPLQSPAPSIPATSTGMPSNPSTPSVTDPSQTCLADRIVVTTAGLTTMPDAPPVAVAENRKVAYVMAEHGDDAGTDRLIVVVTDPAGSHVAALVMGPAGVGNGWAQVRGWSSDGSYFLVEAGRADPLSDAIERNCSDLYVVRADGTQVASLTDSAPGQMAVGGTLVDGGRSVAFAQLTRSWSPFYPTTVDYQLNLHVIHLDRALTLRGPACSVEPPASRAATPPQGLLAASADGSRVAMLCDQGVQTVDLATSKSTLIPRANDGLQTAVAWLGGGLNVATVVRPKATGSQPLIIDRAWWLGGNRGSVKSASSADWAAEPVSFSPDGTRFLAEACEGQDPCRAQITVFDVATGRSQVACRVPGSPAGLDARWLPDGETIAVGRDGVAGSSICSADGSGTVGQSNLPPDAAWWPSAW